MASPSPAISVWSRLNWDVTELILSYLPFSAAARAAAVCRLWRSVIRHPSFAARGRRRPWLFLHGLHNVLPVRNQSFAFDPDDGRWVPLPPAPPLLFAGCGGFAFASAGAGAGLLFAPLVRSAPWAATPPLSSHRSNPLVAVAGDAAAPRFVVVGGARYVGGLVNIEADRLDAEIFRPGECSWRPCPPLPPEFRPGLSSQWLSSALLRGSLLFVSNIYSGLVSSLDVSAPSPGGWSPARVLRPPGLLFGYLLACGDGLILAGLRSGPGVAPAFVIWSVDPRTMGFREESTMPAAILAWLMDAGGDDEEEVRVASLKCVGLDGLLYVFNEDNHKTYPTCLCEVVSGAGEGCRWWKLPPLPGPVNQFHKLVSYASAPSLSFIHARVE